MPNLSQLRGRILNQIDYTPTPSQQINSYLNSVINEAYKEIWCDRPYTFNIKEQDIRVWPDFSSSDIAFASPSTNVLTFTFDSDLATFTSRPYETADPHVNEKFVGAILQDDHGVSYTITNFTASSGVVIKLDRKYEGNTHSTDDYKIYHRWAFLPQDLIEVMDVSFPNYPIDASRRGKIIPIPRRIDVNVDLNQTSTGSNKPTFYVPYSQTHLDPVSNTLSIAATGASSGLAADTYYFAYSVVNAENVESGLCDVGKVTVTNEDLISVTFTSVPAAADETMKLRYKVYYGYKRENQDTYTFYHWETLNAIKDGTGFPTTATFSPTILADVKRGEYEHKRFAESVNDKKIRFYPRPQGVDKTITVGDANFTTSKQTFWHLRYLYKPYELVDDFDVPAIPTAFHNLIVERALIDIHSKYGNEQASLVSDKKYYKRKKVFDARYATERDITLQRSRSMQVGGGMGSRRWFVPTVTYTG